jgi:hypothetical protein
MSFKHTEEDGLCLILGNDESVVIYTLILYCMSTEKIWILCLQSASRRCVGFRLLLVHYCPLYL